MSDHELHGHDAALRAALQQHSTPPPADEVDWDTLHMRITAAAAPRFRRPMPTSWWQLLAGWSPRGMTLAAAASVVLMFAVGSGAIAPRSTPAAMTNIAFVTLEEELAGGSAAFLAVSDDADAVLDALLFRDMEER
jgi:hypothetical protein